MNPTNSMHDANPLGREPTGDLLRKFTIPSIIAMLVSSANDQYPMEGQTNVNVSFRAEPSTASARLGVLKSETKLTVNALITARDGTEWYLVDVDGKSGYVKEEYISMISGAD